MNSLRRKFFSFALFAAVFSLPLLSFSSLAHADPPTADQVIHIPGVRQIFLPDTSNQAQITRLDGTVITLPYTANQNFDQSVDSDTGQIITGAYRGESVHFGDAASGISMVLDENGSVKSFTAGAGANIIQYNSVGGQHTATQDAEILRDDVSGAFNIKTTSATYGINGQSTTGAVSSTDHTNDPGVKKLEDQAQGGCISFTAGLPTGINIEMCVKQSAGVIGNFILSVMAWILWFAGVFFNYSLNYTIHLSTIVNSVPAIGTIWKAFRDIVNMAIIFVLLYTAINTILGIGKDYKAVITNVILAAIFMNFSFFLTGAIIDVSNILSIGIYNAMTPPANYAGSAINSADGGISALVMQSLDLTSLYQGGGQATASTLSSLKSTAFDVWKIVLLTILGSIFMLVTAFTFAAAGVLFMIRTVTLIFVLAFSPMMFATFIIDSPDLKGYAKEWWGALMNQSIFAPLYLFLLYCSLKIITDQQLHNAIFGGGAEKGFADVITGGGSIAIIINFVLVIFFMLGSLLIAKKYSKDSVPLAQNIAGKMTFGVAGAFGRNTAGRVGSYLKDRQWVKSAQDNFPSTLGRVSVPLEALSKATFDARNTPGLPLKAYTGEGVKGGYADDIDARKKEVEKEADKRKGDPARLASYLNSQRAYITGPIANALPKDGILSNFVSAMGFDGQKYAYGKMDARARIKLHAELKKQGNESLVNQLRGSLKGEDREKTIEAELRSDEYKGKPEKAAEYVLSLKDKKPEVLVSEDQKTAYESLPPRDRATLEAALITANKNDLADNLRKSLSQEEQDKTKKAAVEEANKQKKAADLNTIKNPANFTDDQVRDALRKAQPSDIADLDGPEILNQKVLKNLTPKILTAIGKKDKLSQNEFATIMQELRSRPVGDPLHGYLNSKQNEYWI